MSGTTKIGLPELDAGLKKLWDEAGSFLHSIRASIESNTTSAGTANQAAAAAHKTATDAASAAANAQAISHANAQAIAKIRQRTQVKTYDPTGEIFPNPERGLISTSASRDPTPPAPWDPAARMTVEWVLLDLDAYRDTDTLAGSVLGGLEGRLARIRSSGAKAIFRARYTESGSDPRDAPKARVFKHIDQLATVIQKYAAVVPIIQIGWAGPWGECHIGKGQSSNNLVDGTDSGGWILGQIARHQHDANPHATIQLRRGMFAYKPAAPTGPWGLFPGTFPAAKAFDGSFQSLVGFFNDCILDSSQGSWDYGGDGFTRAQRQAVLAAGTKYTPVAGETCGVSSNSQDATALAYLQLMHWDLLHGTYQMDVIKGWAQDTRDELARRLGYRFELKMATISNGAIELTIHNTGFGKLAASPRPLDVVLRGPDTRAVRITDDARKRLPVAGETKTLVLPVPADAIGKGYKLSVKLPDADASIASDTRRSIRFANAGTWNAGTGENDLGFTI